MKPLHLKPHEARRLAEAGEVLIVRPVERAVANVWLIPNRQVAAGHIAACVNVLAGVDPEDFPVIRDWLKSQGLAPMECS